METARVRRIWHAMNKRCNSKAYHAYHRYGGRGISVCEDWANFALFASWATTSGYSGELELDRVDNNKGYSPCNCRWVTRSANCRNTSVSSKHGACVYKHGERFRVKIGRACGVYNVGVHESAELAQLVRDEFEELKGWRV